MKKGRKARPFFRVMMSASGLTATIGTGRGRRICFRGRFGPAARDARGGRAGRGGVGAGCGSIGAGRTAALGFRLAFRGIDRAIIVANGIGQTRGRNRCLLLHGFGGLGAVVGARVAAAVTLFARLTLLGIGTLGPVLTVATVLAVVAALRIAIFARFAGLRIAAAIFAVVTVIAVVIAAIAIAVLIVLLLLAFGLFTLRFAQHAGVMFGVLEEGLLRNAVIGQLGVTRQRQIFFNDLLRGAADLAFGTRGIEYAIDNIAERTLTVRLRTRTGFR